MRYHEELGGGREWGAGNRWYTAKTTTVIFSTVDFIVFKDNLLLILHTAG